MNLAPNGKPSNLTPEQYRLVRTPAFKAWFGDWENSPETASKVVDRNGEPLVVYHGTKSEFTQFKPNKDVVGTGMFFTSNKEYAKNFPRTNKDGQKVLTLFLKIEKPISEDDFFSLGNGEERTYESIKLGYDGLITYDGVFLAFKPEQIKLADGTNTTFDSNNPDIRYKKGGEVLLAPNGKPSNLTPEQYRLVRTPAFKAWFGDWEKFDYQKNKELKGSQIIDFKDYNDLEKKYTNEPIVVYHASNNEFNVFDIEKSDYRERGWFGKGFYFGEKRERVRQYGRIIKPYFLKLSNPFYFNGHQKEFAQLFDLDYWENYDIFSNTIREKIIKLGYDGVVANSIFGVEYVAFYPEQIKLADGTNKTFDGNNPDIRFSKGGSIRKPKKRTISQTPAPKKDRIYGSKINKPKSSESKSKASSIILSPSVIKSIRTIINKHNEEYPNKKVPLSSAKAVVRRGMGAYSSTHRPTISGGKPNSRVAWGLARLNAFIYKIKKGKSKSGKYKQDDDLINELGYKVKPYSFGGQITDEQKETYKKWKELVNMSRSELEKFYNSEEGKIAGLSAKEAKEQGIDSGRESARWIMKMKYVPVSEWNKNMWRWAKKQISFISRMSGMKGKLYDEKGRKTRKHLALLIWGHNPEK